MTASAHEEEGALRRAQAASQRAFFAALARGSAQSRLAAWPGVQATVVPVRPWFSIFNSAFFDDAAALEAGLEHVAQVYDSCAVKAWRVWVAPDEPDLAAILEARGLSAAAETPMLMAARIDELDLDVRTELEVERQAPWEDVARCNDRAHGVLEEYTMAAAFERIDDPPTRRYAVREQGTVVSSLLAREHEGDCYFWFVATVPDAQRRGLGSELMRVALREAHARGARTATLEATRAGEPMYARLGMRALGRFGVFEHMS